MTGSNFVIECPNCGDHARICEDAPDCGCGARFTFRGGVLDLFDPAGAPDGTWDHYSVQWGPSVDFFNWLKANPDAKSDMPSYQLGWFELFEEIRGAARAPDRTVNVYDAACGYGGLTNELFAHGAVPGLRYVGADIHGALADVRDNMKALAGDQIRCVRWDISRPLPLAERFDYVLCRSAIMHTPEPTRTLRALADRLAPGGTLAISVYTRKAPAREALDDAFRARIGAMPSDEALAICRQFSLLGRALQRITQPLEIDEDLPLLGVSAGTYDVQRFLYDHFLKCWYNPKFGLKYSDIVNFDWYHPPHAFRFTLDEVEAWFEPVGLEVRQAFSNQSQHFIRAVKPG